MVLGEEGENGLKIGIDCRLWNETGVGRYTRNLVLNLAKIDTKNAYVLFVRSKDAIEIEKAIGNKSFKIVTSDSRWHSFSEQIRFPKIISREKLDLMHFPYFSVPVFYRSPYVVTIHDLILHHFPTGQASTLPFWLYGFKMLSYRFVINNGVANARRVIAVSDSTKEEIFDHLRVNKQKVSVIYEGADDFKTLKGKKPDFENYFLYVGNVYPHKNVEKMLKAFEKISEENENVRFVFVGTDDYFYKRLRKQAGKLEKANKVIFVFGATDQELLGLYENAIALVRPSLMEGFSLPPLEAMELGCLNLVSAIPVHREILKDSAVYFNPMDRADIEKKMQDALNMEEKQKQLLIQKGKEISKHFSWEEVARQTLKVYESSLSL